MFDIDRYIAFLGLSRLKNSGFKAFFSLSNILLRKGKFIKALSSYKKAFEPLFTNKSRSGWSENYCPEATFVIDHKYNFIYCPIGKVASSSLKRVMVQLSDLDNKEEILTLPKGFIHAYVDRTLSLSSNYSYQEAMEIINDDRYFKFVIVRNPWERLASAYLNRFVSQRNLKQALFAPPKYIKNVIDDVYIRKGLKPNYQKSISFREFIDYICLTKDEKLDGHWCPQYLYLGNTKFNFIGKLENIDRDFKYIQKQLGIEIDLPWKNKTNRIDSNNNDEGKQIGDRYYCDLYPLDLTKLEQYPLSREMYTPDLIELVDRRYKKDIEMFDYNY